MSQLQRSIQGAHPPVKNYTGILPYAVGQRVPEGGIYAGIWRPTNTMGQRLGKEYTVFAAPEDATNLAKGKPLLMYAHAAFEVASLRGWHGHGGEFCPNNEILCSLLTSGNYTGGWIIPTIDMLAGMFNYPDEVCLYRTREQGDFAGTFQTKPGDRTTDNVWYWSSTGRAAKLDEFMSMNFETGRTAYKDNDSRTGLSVRPVRLEELRLA